MKKIIGIVTVLVIAFTFFTNSTEVNERNSTLSIDDLLAMNTANAECGPAPSCSDVCYYNPRFNCYLTCELNYITCYYSFPY